MLVHRLYSLLSVDVPGPPPHNHTLAKDLGRRTQTLSAPSATFALPFALLVSTSTVVAGPSSTSGPCRAQAEILLPTGATPEAQSFCCAPAPLLVALVPACPLSPAYDVSSLCFMEHFSRAGLSIERTPGSTGTLYRRMRRGPVRIRRGTCSRSRYLVDTLAVICAARRGPLCSSLLFSLELAAELTHLSLCLLCVEVRYLVVRVGIQETAPFPSELTIYWVQYAHSPP